MKSVTLFLGAMLSLIVVSPAFPAGKPYLEQRGAGAKCNAIADWIKTADRSAGAILDDDVYDQRLVTHAYIDRVFASAVGAEFESLSERKLYHLRNDLVRCDGSRHLMAAPLGREIPKRFRRYLDDGIARTDETNEWRDLIRRHNEFDMLSVDGRFETKKIPVSSLRRMRDSEQPDDVIVNSNDVRRVFVPSIDQFNALMIVIDEVDKRAREAANSAYTYRGRRLSKAVKKDRFLAFEPNYLEIAQLESLALVDYGLELVLSDYHRIQTDLFEHGMATKEDFIAVVRQVDHFMYFLRESVDKIKVAAWAGTYQYDLENDDIDAAIAAILDRLAAAESRTHASMLAGYKSHFPTFVREIHALQTEEQFAEYGYAYVRIFYSGASVGSKAARDSGLRTAFWDRKKALGLHPERLIHRGWEADRRAREQARRQQQLEAAAIVLTILGATGAAWLDCEPH